LSDAKLESFREMRDFKTHPSEDAVSGREPLRRVPASGLKTRWEEEGVGR